jgi:hypothetical protein
MNGEGMNVIYFIVPTMVLSGMLGGAVNLFIADPATEKPLRWWKHLLIGIAAALIVPVFLNMISSNLVSQIEGPIGTSGPLSKLLVLDGFCVLAAISSRAFIRSLTDRLMQQVNDYKKQNDEANKTMQHSIKKVEGGVEEAKMLANIAQDAPKVQAPAVAAAAAPVAARGLNVEAFSSDDALPEIRPGTEPNDPWKRVFGGHRVDKEKGRELSAKVVALESAPGWYGIELTVSALPGAAALNTPVQFFLHDTFLNNKPIVTPANNIATLHLKGWGAFTVGVLTDEGTCKLELDLAELSSAPLEFRSR